MDRRRPWPTPSSRPRYVDRAVRDDPEQARSEIWPRCARCSNASWTRCADTSTSCGHLWARLPGSTKRCATVPGRMSQQFRLADRAEPRGPRRGAPRGGPYGCAACRPGGAAQHRQALSRNRRGRGSRGRLATDGGRRMDARGGRRRPRLRSRAVAAHPDRRTSACASCASEPTCSAPTWASKPVPPPAPLCG